LSAAILYPFLRQNAVGGLGDEIGKGLNGDIGVISGPQIAVELRVCSGSDIPVGLFLYPIVQQGVFYLNIVLFCEGHGVLYGKGIDLPGVLGMGIHRGRLSRRRLLSMETQGQQEQGG
jgi:hypothetical protein